jgi:hypothetical protein
MLCHGNSEKESRFLSLRCDEPCPGLRACVFGTALNFDDNRTPADCVRAVQLMIHVDTNDWKKGVKWNRTKTKLLID